MILPTKHLSAERALLTVGAYVLQRLNHPRTVSGLWDLLRDESTTGQISYDWFVLSLDMLYAAGAVEYDGGLLSRATND